MTDDLRAITRDQSFLAAIAERLAEQTALLADIRDRLPLAQPVTTDDQPPGQTDDQPPGQIVPLVETDPPAAAEPAPPEPEKKAPARRAPAKKPPARQPRTTAPKEKP